MKKRNVGRGLNNTARWMLTMVVGAFLVFYLIIAYAYVNIALTGSVRGQNLHSLALDQYLSGGVSRARRGTILDRHGGVLATQLPSYTLYANLNELHGDVVEDVEETARKLSTVLNLTEDQIIAFLTPPEGEERHQMEFGSAGRGLTFLDKDAINQMELSGIRFREYLRRFYPNGVFASHTIGYTILDLEAENELVGAMGIEQYLNDTLEGSNGRFIYLRDLRGFLQPRREIFDVVEVVDGKDIYLTLDSPIQIFLEKALEDTWQAARPESLVAIVADARTGEILALGSRCTFDPNIREIENHNNIILDAIEPGSTLKIHTYAAAINQGVYQGDKLFESGSRTLANGTRIGDFRRNWGTITFDQGFYHSSNTAIVDMLQNWLEPDIFFDYLDAFGFGRPVGLPLKGEGSGYIPFDAEITQKITAGFGQGITITPIQMIQAMTPFLNEGNLIRPQLISQIYDPNEGEVLFEFEVDIIGQPITPETARRVKDLMIGVVEDPRGTGLGLYDLEGISSGGKTGTAQIPDPEGGYLYREYLFSYVGFAPADEPQLIMYLAMSRPESREQSAHQYLSEIYRFVMTNALNYLGLSDRRISISDIEIEHERAIVPAVINQTLAEATAAATEAGFEVVVIGDRDLVFAQLPLGNSQSMVGRKLFLQTAETDELPDFTGWTRAEVNKYLTLLGLRVEFSGEGFVTEQSLRPGTEVSRGANIRLTLERNP